MFIQDRLVSRSSRSLAVMIGFARSAKDGGRESLRGSPDDALTYFVFHTSLPQFCSKSRFAIRLDLAKEPVWNAEYF